ncbi:phospholipase A2-like [Solea senegalensis]|nr:phospholipase A2-like [Solea senegalensis]KAG7499316.1 phospholipase A2-like [Solea senegalensis]
MKTFQTLILVAVVGLSLAHIRNKRSIPQFMEMIACVMPEGRTVMEHNNYGCYCGYGGQGTPVDDMDRCCQEHDNCYENTRSMVDGCHPIFDNPYTELYSFCCKRNVITCGCGNDNCEATLCECDKKAAECFARTPIIEKYKDMSRENC